MTGPDNSEHPTDPTRRGTHTVEAPAEDTEEREPTISEMVAEQIGGVRGIVEASVPVLVFILVNSALPRLLPGHAALQPAIWSAIGSAVVIAVVRLARRDSIRYAVNGLFGVALAAFFAVRSGKAEDFFLPGIWLSYGEGALFAISVLVRRPVVGYAWTILTAKHADWRERPRLLRAFSLFTLAFTAAFWINSSIQLALYYAGMSTAVIGSARLLGKGLYIGAAVLTVWYGRRVIAAEDAEAPPQRGG